MSEHCFPSIGLLDKTNLNSEYRHSMLISLLRGLAALQVAAAHLRAHAFPSLREVDEPTLWYLGLAFLTGFAHQAVVVFFVLSGWLVGGSLLNRLQEPGVMLSYAIDRITRMWLVLIPAFVLTLLLGLATGAVASASGAPDNPYTLSAFIGNLVGLQDMAVPRYGGNFALWSLANEIWYYVLFPLAVLAWIGGPAPVRIAAALATIAIAAALPGQIILYFTIWLLGVGVSRIRIVTARAGRWLLLGLLAMTSVYFRITGSNDILTADSYLQDLLFSIVFLAFLAAQQFEADRNYRPTRVTRKLGELLAGFSFTLYVIHVPLLLAMRSIDGPLAAKLSPHAPGDLAIYLAALALIVAAAWLFHLPFEAQTYRVRRALKAALSGRLAPARS